MMQWFVIIVLGIGTFVGFYMAFLAFQVDDGGAFLFACFGVLFGIPFATLVIRIFSKKIAFLEKIDEKISGEPRPVTFVPHWFVIAAVVVAGAGIVAAVLIPMLFN